MDLLKLKIEHHPPTYLVLGTSVSDEASHLDSTQMMRESKETRPPFQDMTVIVGIPAFFSHWATAGNDTNEQPMIWSQLSTNSSVIIHPMRAGESELNPSQNGI